MAFDQNASSGVASAEREARPAILAIGTAAVLLWPFSGWSLIPWLVGIGVLVLLRLLRLDGLLRGWVFHLGGVVVVVGLMYSTDPWAWALAASIGVLLAGLLQLPWWRLAAVGAAMCVVSGVGFGITSYHTAQVQREIESHAGDQLRSRLGESRSGRILPALLQALDVEPGTPVQPGGLPGEGPRLQDVLDVGRPLEVRVHEGFDFWAEDAQ